MPHEPKAAGLFEYGTRNQWALHPPREAKFLAFQADPGGFNNILMNFELVVVLASLTGRTLILPPARPFYLLGDAERTLPDFFDRARLEDHLTVWTAAEFAERLDLDPAVRHHDGFHHYMERHGHNPDWHSGEDVVVDPPDALTTRLELIPRLLRRRPVAVMDQVEQADILYLPNTWDRRLLGPFETFYLFADPKRERAMRALVRDAVRFRPEILEMAERLLQAPELGSPFGAMHLRRGDFQYLETRIAAERIVAHTAGLFDAGATLYVATDERDADFLQPLRERYHVITLGALESSQGVRVPESLRGIVECLLCAAAPGRFAGTRLSTFTARIGTLRGYLSTTPGGPRQGIDATLYYTQPQPLASGQAPDTPEDETAQPWWAAASKSPLWSRAYLSVWEDAEVEGKTALDVD